MKCNVARNGIVENENISVISIINIAEDDAKMIYVSPDGVWSEKLQKAYTKTSEGNPLKVQLYSCIGVVQPSYSAIVTSFPKKGTMSYTPQGESISYSYQLYFVDTTQGNIDIESTS